MSQFVVDFSESLNALTRFQAGVSALGTQLDKVQANSGNSVGAVQKLLAKLDAEYVKIEQRLNKIGADSKAIQSAMEGIRQSTTQAMSGVAAANLKATVSAQAFNGEMNEMRRLLEDTAKKNGYVQSMTRISQINNALINSNRELSAQIQSLDSSQSKLNAALRLQLQAKREIQSMDQRTATDNAKLQAALAQLNTERSKENQLLRQAIANRQSEYRESAKLDGQLQALERQYRSLSGGLQQQITEMQQMISARKREITEASREQAEIQRLERALKSLSGGRQEEIAKLNAQIAARKKVISEALTERQAVDELTAALKREEAQLTRLRAQAQLMAGAHGQQVAALRAQIAEQTHLNNLRAMSTRSLLGLQGSQERHNLSMQAGSQVAAMLRAGITGLHASFGMYTSATVLAASATYAFTAGLRDSVITGAEFYDTMQRTKAIMSTSGASWLTNDNDYAKAMEEQVRSLGMTTVYTASEVGQGLQELGKAGFSASSSIEALPAALQLANLANVSMSRSADIATNVLMTFNKEAKDLGGVVDLMATAVNNSNTDIEQLANALTYVGPAAHTAGISLEETVAAIEALANSGFKSSRAGTGLRRLFVSLLNPTEKGRAVLDKFNISVLDAEGQTRSLVDIVGQLNKAFSSLQSNERLGAVQDLVGTYASSQVAALIDQSDNFEKFANQNQAGNVAGAGDRMEAIINDALKKDWKTLMSSIEEVQLNAFGQLDMRLRRQVASMSNWVLDLLKPSQEGFGVFSSLTDNALEFIGAADEGARAAQRQAEAVTRLANARSRLSAAQDGVKTAMAGGSPEQVKSAEAELRAAQDLVNSSQISSLDRMLVEIQTTAQVITGLVGGVLAYKFVNGSIFAGIGRDLSGPEGATKRLQEFTRRQAEQSTVAIANAQATRAAGGSIGVLGSTSLVARVGVVGLSQSLTALTIAASRAAAVLAGISRVLGWAGLLYGIYYAVTTVFNSDTEQSILDQQNAVDQVRSSYDELAESIKQTGLERQKNALRLAQRADQGSVDQFSARIATTEGLLNDAKTSGAPAEVIKAYTAEIESLKTQQAEYAARVTEADINLEKFGKTELDVKDVQAQRMDILAELVRLQKELNAAQLNASVNADLGGAVPGLQAQQAAALERLRGKTSLVQNVKAQVVPISSYFADAERERLAAVEEEAYKKTTSNAQQLLDTQVKLTAERQKRADLEARDAAAIQNNGRRVGQDEASRVNSQISALEVEERKLREKVEGEQVQYDLARREAASKTLSDAQNLTNAKARDLEIAKELAALENPGEGKARDLSKITGLLREQASVRQEINSITTKGGKADNKAERDAASELKSAQTQYDGLAKKFDALSHSQRELEKGTAAMNLLRANGIITAEQENKALGELNLQHYEAVMALDKNHTALEKLRESYRTSPFGIAAEDLGLLNRNLQEGRVSLEEFNRIYAQIREKQLSQATSGLPKADISSGEFSGSVFTDLVEKVDQTSTGNREFEKRQRDLENSFDIQNQANEDRLANQMEALAARKLAEEQNAQELLEIEKNYQDAKTGIARTASEQQNAVAQQSAEFQNQMGQVVLAGALGTAANILGQFASASEEATTAQKAAFAIQKALAVAQIIIYTELAAARATGEMPFGLGISMAAFIRGVGYANAGMVAGLAIGSLAGGGSSSSGSSSSTPMYDTGGFIPYNRVGIVGEYGPELVRGPAAITGRTATAGKMSGGGGGDLHVTIAPQVIMQGGESSGSGTNEDAKQIATTVKSLVVEKVQDMIRPGGLLYEWNRNPS